MDKTTDTIIDEIEATRPGFKAEVARHMAEREANLLAQQQRDAEVLEAYRNRPKPKFAELPFVGKKYRSRNRRSADKLTAWAVVPEQGAMAAVQGFEYARQFLHHINARANDRQPGLEAWAGYGVALENIIVGMADTLANCKPDDKNAHLTVIRGFCSALEWAAIMALDSFSPEEKYNADTYQIRMASFDDKQPHVYDCNARQWACRLEKQRMLAEGNAS